MRADGHIIVLRHVELGADHNFDVPPERQILSLRLGGLGLTARGHAQGEQSSQKANA